MASSDVIAAARKIAERYMAENPPEPLSYRAFYDNGIRRRGDYRYEADFNALFPEAKLGDAAEVRCVYIAKEDDEIGLSITLFGGAEVRVNGERVFESDVFCERNNDVDIKINVPVKKGRTFLSLRLKRPRSASAAFSGRRSGSGTTYFSCPTEAAARAVATG